MKGLKSRKGGARHISTRRQHPVGAHSTRLGRRPRNAPRRTIGSRAYRARESSRLKGTQWTGVRITSAQYPLEKQQNHAQFQTLLKNFDAAARYFQKQNYEKAKELFEKLVSAPTREIAERARVHLQLCEQKLGRPVSTPKTAEGYYTLGVAELNARHVDSAVQHLSMADKLEPNCEHTRYALAAAHALQGNADAALDHLKVAIGVRPENRFLARRDSDFQSLASDPRFKRLTHSEPS